MASDIDAYIRDNYPWAKLPKNTRQLLGNSAKEYEKLIVEYSVKNQLRYKGNLVRYVKKNEEQYYELLMQYSRQHLMLYPYHLSDVIVKGLRTTPFQYYVRMMDDLMGFEKSYDSLPNFTAADCLRLLGIGRNQYIDLMNQCRSMKKAFRKKPIRDILPQKPVDIIIQPWWLVQIGHILEDDVRSCTKEEKETIDLIVDDGAQNAGRLDMTSLKRLYARGLIYLDVPVHDDDHIIVPPLDGFVMNRVLGDYFETILYKIFVSIDEHTTVAELAKILEIDLQLVKNAVALFCRLGFAQKKIDENSTGESSANWARKEANRLVMEGPLLVDLSNSLSTPLNDAGAGPSLIDLDDDALTTSADDPSADTKSISESIMANPEGRRFGFLFDSALTAFLMMGNLSNSLKSHAVTLFEVGKLNDEALDSFLEELNKVQSFSEGGEAQRYFEHAQVLKDTIEYLRAHSELDLIRCESLMGLDPLARLRLLKKNYQLLISMAPLSNEVSPVNCNEPPHLGPSVVEVNSPWFRLFLYNLIGQGPVSLLMVKGTRVRRLPKALKPYRRLLLCTWGHDPGIVSADSCLIALNDSLQHSAVFIQGYSLVAGDAEVVHIPFPHSEHEVAAVIGDNEGPLYSHPAVHQLSKRIGLRHSCGYVTLMRSQATLYQSPATNALNGGIHGGPGFGDSQQPIFGFGASVSRDPRKVSSSRSIDEKQLYNEWTLYDCVFGLPLFDRTLNKMICDRLKEHQLLAGNSLNEIRECSTTLSTMVLDFIKDFQPLASEKDYYGSSDERRVPYPLHSLIFENGAVRIWDGV